MDGGYFRRKHAYEVWAGGRYGEALSAARTHLERDGVAAEAAPFVRAVEIFSHIQAARRVWLWRIGTAQRPEDGVFPVWPLGKALAEHAAMDEQWGAYMNALTPAHLEVNIDYRNMEGIAYTNTVSDIITHVINHSSYHRGQLARLLAESGLKPPVTDFIVFARENP
ncbi:MAG: DinB family protein [Phycisphaerales bacterium]|nr:DinB family protein [Phycisphaerales bacterium]